MKAAKTPAEKSALARKRTDITWCHIHQKRGEKFLLPLTSMAYEYVPVELLHHHLHLNLPKVGFKWLIRRHLSLASRQAAISTMNRVLRE